MKKLKVVAISIFSMLIILPLIGFRFGEGIVSEIDNRKLQDNPFRAEERTKKTSLKGAVVAYINDRIGFRDEMILAYTLLNDRLFGEMVHPTYRYGKDGYVYYRGMTTPIYGEYHESFADMIKQIQDYCEMRDVPFLFVFEPLKQHILEQYLPAGVHYDVRWVNDFFRALDERGVHYVDNTATLRQKIADGEIVFNRQYDAGHWNEKGQFFGTNAILEELHKRFERIRPNNIDDFESSAIWEPSLPVSKFPIHENVPTIIVPLDNIENMSNLYNAELERHKQYRGFGYYRNQTHWKEIPRVLVFQGSYLNKANSKFLKYALGDYIIVHDYQNILEFPYYFNIFKPECVVFEVAENTIDNGYFDAKKMESLKFNPPLSTVVRDNNKPPAQHLPTEAISVQQGKALTKIIWKNAPQEIEYMWCVLGDEFDMRPSTEGGYEITVKNEVWQKHQKEMQIVTIEQENLHTYIQ